MTPEPTTFDLEGLPMLLILAVAALVNAGAFALGAWLYSGEVEGSDDPAIAERGAATAGVQGRSRRQGQEKGCHMTELTPEQEVRYKKFQHFVHLMRELYSYGLMAQGEFSDDRMDKQIKTIGEVLPDLILRAANRELWAARELAKIPIIMPPISCAGPRPSIPSATGAEVTGVAAAGSDPPEPAPPAATKKED
jgi:hypothetical protein